METHINSWGNSLAVRIPKAIAKELGFQENSLVDMRAERGCLSIKPVLPTKKKRKYTLEDLLAKIPEGYAPTSDPEVIEWMNAKPVGKEIIEDDWS